MNYIGNNYKLLLTLLNRTPLQYNHRLSNKYRCNIYYKREDLQITRSFKIRGALNKVLSLNSDEKYEGIVCASAGNHAQGVAWISTNYNIKSNIFIPECTPQQKINKICSYATPGLCSIHIVGNTFDKCLNVATTFTKATNKTFIHPYNDKKIIDGHQTIAHEIFEDLEYINEEPQIIIGGIGGGGLMSGLSLYNNIYSKEPAIMIGVEPTTCPSMRKSVDNGYISEHKSSSNFVDGATVEKVGDITYNMCSHYIDYFYDVSIKDICKTIIDLHQEDGIISEPAGALSIASLDKISKDQDIRGQNVVCILSGGNNDMNRYNEILQNSF
tara:strand:- start:1079 stop:2062 length:984 start_codon:yes stop_codon:yes gene_type:complete